MTTFDAYSTLKIMKREIQIALLAIITAILAFWGYNFISGKNLLSNDNSYHTIIGNAKEINTATPVLINGYQVGTVTSIQPMPEDIRKIKLSFQVKNEIKIPSNTIIEVRPEGPLGGKELELVFDKFCDGSNCAEPGAVLESKMIGLLGSIITPEELDPHITTVTTSLHNTLGKLGSPDSDTPVDNTIRNLSVTMDNLAKSTSSLSNLMTRSSRDMEKTLSNMAILTEALVNSNEKLANILNNVGTLSNDLAKVSLSETVGKSNKTIDQATSSLQSVEKTMEQATKTMTELNQVMTKLSSDEGSLGLLMNDKALYNNLSTSTKNMNLLLQDIRLNPKRYFKVFGKKVPKYELPENDPANGG